jgi:alkaline phosphatase D
MESAGRLRRLCKTIVPRLFVACACLLLVAADDAAARQKRRKLGHYKRIHRKAWAAISNGRPEKAAELLNTIATAKPKDRETLFFLAITHAQLKDLEKADEYVRKAVDAGLPFSRFLAGPGEWTKPLVDSPGFKKLAEKHSENLVHGPMLGCMTDTGAKFWVRTAGEADVQVSVLPALAEDVARPIKSTAVRTTRAADNTAVVEVNGLKPGTAYAYTVHVNGKAVERVGNQDFVSFPKAGAKAAFTVVFGGGAGYVPENERMWDVILKHRPIALVLLGDNVYIDTPKSPAVQRYHYYRRQSRPEWRRLVARTPVYAVWDDHDFGTNDCVPGHKPFQPDWKPKVWEVFKQNWNNPYYGGGAKQPGCWFDFAIGDVDFFLTDSRYYRSLKKRSMLGPAQKAWLFRKLKASKATFKVLANGVPWAEGTKGRSRDTWDGFPEEREEIFSFIE